MIGDRYTFPAGILNSVTSVSHFSFGLSDLKFLCKRLGTAGPLCQ